MNTTTLKLQELLDDTYKRNVALDAITQRYVRDYNIPLEERWNIFMTPVGVSDIGSYSNDEISFNCLSHFNHRPDRNARAENLLMRDVLGLMKSNGIGGARISYSNVVNFMPNFIGRDYQIVSTVDGLTRTRTFTDEDIAQFKEEVMNRQYKGYIVRRTT